MTLPPEQRRTHYRTHSDHSVDHLRQALFCHGDLTLVNMKPVNTSAPYYKHLLIWAD